MGPKLFKLGVSPGGPGSHRPLYRYREWIRALSEDGRENLIAYILHLWDQALLSFSQTYALIHVARYLDSNLDTQKRIRKELGFAGMSHVSELFHGTQTEIKKGGALDVIGDQPEVAALIETGMAIPAEAVGRILQLLRQRSERLPTFRVNAVKDEKSEHPSKVVLSVEQRRRIVRASLKGATNVAIAERLPYLVGDLRVQTVSDSSVSTFLHHEARTKETRGALPVLSGELEKDGVLVSGRLDESALRQRLQEIDSKTIYHLTAVKVARAENPSDILGAIRTFEHKLAPLMRLARLFWEYAEARQYPFDLDFVFFVGVADSSRIEDQVFASEMAHYFSNHVLPRTGKPEEFFDALFYIFEPAHIGYYFSVKEAAHFFANVYQSILDPDAKRVWAETISRFANGSTKIRTYRRRFAKAIYPEFIRRIFPQVRFYSEDEMSRLSDVAKRGRAPIDRSRQYDFAHILEKISEYEARVAHVQSLVRGFFELISDRSLAKAWHVDPDNMDEIYEDVLGAAWDFDPERLGPNGTPIQFNAFATDRIKFGRGVRYAKERRRGEKEEKGEEEKLSIRRVDVDEDGKFIELQEMPDADLPPSDLAERLDRFQLDKFERVLKEHFSPLEQAVIKLANGLDDGISIPLADKEIAQVLLDRGITRSQTGSRIHQIRQDAMEKLIRLLNEPSSEDIAVWDRFLRRRSKTGEWPGQILREVKDGTIALTDSFKLTGYGGLHNGRSVFVSVVKVDDIARGAHESYILLEVIFRGNVVGATLLRIGVLGQLVDQLKCKSREEALSILRGIQEDLSNPVIDEDENATQETFPAPNGTDTKSRAELRQEDQRRAYSVEDLGNQKVTTLPTPRSTLSARNRAELRSSSLKHFHVLSFEATARASAKSSDGGRSRAELRSSLLWSTDPAFEGLSAELGKAEAAAAEKFRRAIEGVMNKHSEIASAPLMGILAMTHSTRLRVMVSKGRTMTSLRAISNSNGDPESGKVISPQAVILGNGFVRDYGVLLAKVGEAFKGASVVAVAVTRAELRFVDIANGFLPKARKIQTARTYQEAARFLSGKSRLLIGSGDDALLLELLIREDVIGSEKDFIAIREPGDLQQFGIWVDIHLIREGRTAYLVSINA